jgi:SAM-dependent methyltransferase
MSNQLEWTQRRIKGIIDYYGHEFMHHKKILDLGCGQGEIGGALNRLGADVTAVDARQDHLKLVAKKFPSVKIVKADLDVSWPFIGAKFDLILDLGILCHIRDFHHHLKSVCASCTHLILETAVCDSDDPARYDVVQENKSDPHLSVNGLGGRPSVAAIEKILKENGMSFKRLDSSKFNSGAYNYDWAPKNNGESFHTKRRIWFAVKNINIMPATTPSVIKIQPAVSSPGYIPTLKDTRMQLSASPKIHAFQGKTETPIADSSNMLRVALCISGHLRTFDRNFASLKDSILTRYNCDVFIHTWDQLGMSYRFGDAKLHMLNPNNMMDRINYFYNPKQIVIESQSNFKASPLMIKKGEPGRDTVGTASMYYKIEACNKLKQDYEKQNNFKYDFVIRFRSDLFVEQPLPLDQFTSKDYLYVPIFGNFGGINDQIAFGGSEVMDLYSSCYSNIENLLKNGAWMNPEKLLQFHVEDKKIPLLKVPMRYNIRRANGLVQDNMLLERAIGFIR